MILHKHSRILAIDPSTKGFGFAVLELRRRLVDWGSARIWATSEKEFLARVECLVTRYRPVLIVLEDITGRRRSRRNVRRHEVIGTYARSRGLGPRTVTQAEVLVALDGVGSTKREIALGVAALFPELEVHLPPVRKPWMSEDERTNLFEATALGIAALSTASLVRGRIASGWDARTHRRRPDAAPGSLSRGP